MKDGKTIITVEGMGPDAEVTTNAAGGQQSQAPNAFHLVDPYVAIEILDIIKPIEYEGLGFKASMSVEQANAFEAFKICLDYMGTYMDAYLVRAMEKIERDPFVILQTIAGRLMYGITKGNNGKGYPTNNWRLIPREEHLNHAMNHMFAIVMGDTQDDHRSAAICRLHMASATKESRGFRYQEYIDVASLPEEKTVVEKMREIKSRAQIEHVTSHERLREKYPPLAGDQMIGPGTGPITNMNFAQGELSPLIKTKDATMLDVITDEEASNLPESKESPAGILHYIFTITTDPKTMTTARKCVEKGMNLKETLVTCGFEIDNSEPGTITEFKK